MVAQIEFDYSGRPTVEVTIVRLNGDEFEGGTIAECLRAVIDTAAPYTLIRRAHIPDGIKPIGPAQIRKTGGDVEGNNYGPTNIWISGISKPCTINELCDFPSLDVDVLLGRDVLGQLTLIYDGPPQRGSLLGPDDRSALAHLL